MSFEDTFSSTNQNIGNQSSLGPLLNQTTDNMHLGELYLNVSPAIPKRGRPAKTPVQQTTVRGRGRPRKTPQPNCKTIVVNLFLYYYDYCNIYI